MKPSFKTVFSGCFGVTLTLSILVYAVFLSFSAIKNHGFWNAFWEFQWVHPISIMINLMFPAIVIALALSIALSPIIWLIALRVSRTDPSS